MTKFLSHNSEKALIEVKELLYERMQILKTCIKDSAKDENGYIDPFDEQMNNEISFLEGVLDTIEKS